MNNPSKFIGNCLSLDFAQILKMDYPSQTDDGKSVIQCENGHKVLPTLAEVRAGQQGNTVGIIIC